MKFIILTTLLFVFYSTSNWAMAKMHNIQITFNETAVNLKNDVRFFLYTRADVENPQQLWIDNKRAIKTSAYNTSKATKFMTHGWLNTYEGLNCKTVRRAFLAHDDYNVIVVDWGNVAKLPYKEAASRIKVVGAYIAKMISFLESQGSDPNDMSLVGHSLGAHVMGLAGYQATNKVGHVLGLDPASGGFESAGPGFSISSSDAKLVEIIHTNDGVWGLARPAGHVDFYANGGGAEQPGCGPDKNHYCAHDRAYVYYAEAITKPDAWYALRCHDYETFLKGQCNGNEVVQFPNAMGRGVKKNGVCYLRTAKSAPFGLGVDGARPAKKHVKGSKM